jgi:signal transduction histidine kinase
LVSNAVKYTETGGVEVRTERADGWVRITVADTGIGIPADAIPCLFQEFFRARNAKASREPGTGLGLAIVKELVERYGGQVEVESAEGVGTTFVVQLPVPSE